MWNSFRLACSLEELEWAKEFVSSYAHKLLSFDQESIALFEATLEFCKKDYKACLRIISTHTLKHPKWESLMLKTKMKCHIELNENVDYIAQELNKVLKYLNYHKSGLSKNVYNVSMAFCTAIKCINKRDIDALEELVQNENVSYKKWLGQKLDELKQEAQLGN